MANYVPHTLTIRTVHQTNNHFCGAACAKMILDFIGAEKFTQGFLYKEIHKFKTIDPRKKWKWASSPDGLKSTLNKHRPQTFGNVFEIRKSIRQIAVAKRMADVISKDQVPCIALVHSDRHWLIVNGYDSMVPDPGRPDPKSPDIGGIYIRDPLKSDTQRHADYNQWIDRFCDVPVLTGTWNDKFLAICDPLPFRKKKGQKHSSVTLKSDLKKFYGKTPGEQNISILNKETPQKTKIDAVPLNEPIKSFEPTLINGKKIIDEATVKNYSLWWMKERGFNELKMQDMIKDKPVPTKPVLIQYFGKKEYYFLVPMKENDKKISVIMFMDGTNANYQETIFATNKPMSFKTLSPKKILNLLIDNNDISKKGKKITIQRTLVWKPCNQSLFPEQPFYVVKIGTRKRYVRIDGKIFRRLTKITTAL
jgi:hypothetical protein